MTLLLLVLAAVRPARRTAPPADDGTTTYWSYGKPISRREYLSLGGDDQ